MSAPAYSLGRVRRDRESPHGGWRQSVLLKRTGEASLAQQELAISDLKQTRLERASPDLVEIEIPRPGNLGEVIDVGKDAAKGESIVAVLRLFHEFHSILRIFDVPAAKIRETLTLIVQNSE